MASNPVCLETGRRSAARLKRLRFARLPPVGVATGLVGPGAPPASRMVVVGGTTDGARGWSVTFRRVSPAYRSSRAFRSFPGWWDCADRAGRPPSWWIRPAWARRRVAVGVLAEAVIVW